MPSKLKGRVTIAITRAPISLAIWPTRGAAPGPCPASHARGDEDQVCALKSATHLFLVLGHRLPTDLRPGTGPETARQLAPDLQTEVRGAVVEGLCVRVDRHELDPFEVLVDHTVHGVPSGASHADDFHAGVPRRLTLELEYHLSLPTRLGVHPRSDL